MSQKLPSEVRSEVGKAENFQIKDVGRDYRKVNQDNYDGGGMDKLRPEDYGRGSTQRGAGSSRKAK